MGDGVCTPQSPPFPTHARPLPKNRDRRSRGGRGFAISCCVSCCSSGCLPECLTFETPSPCHPKVRQEVISWDGRRLGDRLRSYLSVCACATHRVITRMGANDLCGMRVPVSSETGAPHFKIPKVILKPT